MLLVWKRLACTQLGLYAGFFKWPQRQLTWTTTLCCVSVFWSADMNNHTVLCICVLISWHENTVFIFFFFWTNLLYVSWTHCLCLCSYQLTWAHCVFVFWSTKLLCESQKHCVMCLRSYEQTCCMCHEHAVFVFLSTDPMYVSQKHSLCLCSNQLTGCVGHEHTVYFVFLSTDLLCGSRKHCVCVLINSPVVWDMNTLCLSLSTDLLCGSWAHGVVCPYQMTCCIGHGNTVFVF